MVVNEDMDEDTAKLLKGYTNVALFGIDTRKIGELGAVDVGGGGTVALFVAGMDVDVVDMGVPILSMHAPFELASKLDIYNTYLAFAAFCS